MPAWSRAACGNGTGAALKAVGDGGADGRRLQRADDRVIITIEFWTASLFEPIADRVDFVDVRWLLKTDKFHHCFP
jgi:hypothetical protein